ncbi:MAG: hypothetical protein Q4B94_00345 [Pseudomonadota bacterium]|nr:hypothetical protein [Pseudomonadota bacterium]
MKPAYTYPSTMRRAFAAATYSIPRTERTRTYATIKSALGRGLGLVRHRTGWTIQRQGGRKHVRR